MIFAGIIDNLLITFIAIFKNKNKTTQLHSICTYPWQQQLALGTHTTLIFLHKNLCTKSVKVVVLMSINTLHLTENTRNMLSSD